MGKSPLPYLLLILINTAALFWAWNVKQEEKRIQVPPQQPWQQPYQPPAAPPVKPEPRPLNVTAYPATYISYDEIRTLMQKWAQEAPEIAEYGEYGRTSRGTPCTYLRVGTKGKPKVCIHAELHGNEKLSTAATMWIMHKMLTEYAKDPEITWLVENRDVWWIPVLSPDTHMRSRHVEGRDPNRDYPYPGRRAHTPTSPVRNIIALHEREKFKGVISGHTYGTVYFWPSIGNRQDQEIHKELARKMGAKSGYNASRISSRPNGYEIDYYYSTGAVAILTEFGSGGHNQSVRAITEHGRKNYEAYMLFIKESPDLAERLSPPRADWKKSTSEFPRPTIHIDED
jgi:predicted deacylase